MKVPQLKKKPELKSCHNTTWEDNYSWIHQDNILEVLKDSSKLLPDVRKYLEEENNFTEYNLKDTKKYQKILFDEIKGRIKLDDESLKYKDKEYGFDSSGKIDNYYEFDEENNTLGNAVDSLKFIKPKTIGKKIFLLTDKKKKYILECLEGDIPGNVIGYKKGNEYILN